MAGSEVPIPTTHTPSPKDLPHGAARPGWTYCGPSFGYVPTSLHSQAVAAFEPFLERIGKWKSGTQPREFVATIERECQFYGLPYDGQVMGLLVHYLLPRNVSSTIIRTLPFNERLAPDRIVRVFQSLYGEPRYAWKTGLQKMDADSREALITRVQKIGESAATFADAISVLASVGRLDDDERRILKRFYFIDGLRNRDAAQALLGKTSLQTMEQALQYYSELCLLNPGY